jgi:hypothetical protein
MMTILLICYRGSSEQSDEEPELWARAMDQPGFEDNVSPHNVITALLRFTLAEVSSLTSSRHDESHCIVTCCAARGARWTRWRATVPDAATGQTVRWRGTHGVRTGHAAVLGVAATRRQKLCVGWGSVSGAAVCRGGWSWGRPNGALPQSKHSLLSFQKEAEVNVIKTLVMLH